MNKWCLMLISMFIILTCTLFMGCSLGKSTEEPLKEKTEINVSAAMGLKEALLDIQKEYEQAHPNVKIVYNFAAAGVLATQIDNGAKCDVFISASMKQINDLKAVKLIDSVDVKNIVGDRLVLVVQKGNPLGLKTFNDLARVDVKKIGFGEINTMPAGQYGKECLENMGIWNIVEPKIVMGRNVREVVAYVESGDADAAVAFSTVAAHIKNVEIAASSPSGTHKPVIFPGAIINTTKNKVEASKFLDYLKEKQASAIFSSYGFADPDKI